MAHTIDRAHVPSDSRHHHRGERNRQLVRQLQILRRLASSRAPVTYYALAADFGVSTRTIRRDLAALQEVGFPLVDVTVDEDTCALGWRMLESREVSRLMAVEVR